MYNHIFPFFCFVSSYMIPQLVCLGRHQLTLVAFVFCHLTDTHLTWDRFARSLTNVAPVTSVSARVTLIRALCHVLFIHDPSTPPFCTKLSYQIVGWWHVTFKRHSVRGSWGRPWWNVQIAASNVIATSPPPNVCWHARSTRRVAWLPPANLYNTSEQGDQASASEQLGKSKPKSSLCKTEQIQLYSNLGFC